jgi:hypothetical protein
MQDAEFNFVASIRDVNNDGYTDVIYCSGYEGEDLAPKMLAATFAEGSWRVLNESEWQPRSCDASRPTPVATLPLDASAE